MTHRLWMLIEVKINIKKYVTVKSLSTKQKNY